MPQLDLETLLCGGGEDRKVACVIDGGDRPYPPVMDDPDLPAESFVVRIGDELDWVDVNAVYERVVSTKGGSNPKSNHSNAKPGSNSQRFSKNLKPKAPIIGLPNKIQPSGYLGRSDRRPANVGIFPKKTSPADGAGGRPAVQPSEPGSPRVSCFGKVVSEGESDRSRMILSDEGCWTSLLAVFRRGGLCGWGQPAAMVECVEDDSSAASGSIPAPKGKIRFVAAEPAMMAPGLGGMNRFASGRRAASWGGDVDVEMEMDGHVEESGREGMLGRRSVGSLEDANRDW